MLTNTEIVEGTVKQRWGGGDVHDSGGGRGSYPSADITLAARFDLLACFQP